MRGIQILLSRERPAHMTALHLAFLLSGVYSVLLLLPSVPGLRFPAAGVYLIPLLSGLILWGAARMSWRFGIRAAALGTAVWIAAAFRLRRVVYAQCLEAIRLLRQGGTGMTAGETAGGSAAVGEAALLLSAFLPLALFLLEFLLEAHTLPCLLTTGLFLAGPALGIRPSVEAVLALVAFQAAFQAIHGVGLRQRRDDLAVRDRGHLSAVSGAAAALFLLLAALAAIPLAARNPERIFSPVYWAESRISAAAVSMTGDRFVRFGGSLSRGNHYDTGTVQLTLTASRPPEEPLYLRGFIGGDYNGNWKGYTATENEIFDRVLEAWQTAAAEQIGDRIASSSRSGDWDDPTELTLDEEQANYAREQAKTRFRILYYNMYWNAHALRQDAERYHLLIRFPDGDGVSGEGASGDGRDPRRLLSDSSAGLFPSYPPYRARRIEGGDGGDGVLYSVFEQWDPEAGQAILSGSFPDEQWLETEYRTAAEAVYTRVPEERAARLAELCRTHAGEDPARVTAFILHTLQSRADYSVTPGWTPLNEDLVEHFLFESGLGYCQHFASAAVLMYRLCGIPARYVAGFRADPADFVPVAPSTGSGAEDGEENRTENRGENGTANGDAESGAALWRASLTDQSAHAWAEIYVDGCGWTPVEVTPAASGEMGVPDVPGMDTTSLSGLLEQYRTAAGNAQTSERGDETGDLWRTSADTGKTQKSGWGVGDSLSAPLASSLAAWLREGSGTAALYVLLLLIPAAGIGFFCYRRRILLRRGRTLGTRAAYGRLLALLGFAGSILPDPAPWDGQSPDFPDRLSAAIPAVSRSDAARLQTLALTAAYGNRVLSPEEDAFARRIYDTAAGDLRVRLPWYRNVRFRWWNVFG